MNRKLTVWMLAVLLALSAFPARAAMIAGGEGGSQASSLALLASPEEALQVLRSRPSADADNLGYYFNGVYAGVVSGPQKGWVQVSIGSLTGYLREEDLIIDPPEDIAAAELPTVKVAYKDGPRLTMRAEQNYQSEKLGSYENGTDMTVLGFTEDFAHVMGPDLQVGFMMAWGVDPQLTVSAAREEAKQTAPATPEGTSAPEMPAATPPPDAAAITVDNAGGEGANLRARASSGSESYGLYMNGTKVYLLRWGEWWCRVWADGKTGYMMTKMLDVQQPN